MSPKVALFIDKALGIIALVIAALIISNMIVANVPYVSPFQGLIVMTLLTLITLKGEPFYRNCALIGLVMWVLPGILPIIGAGFLSLGGFLLWVYGFGRSVRKAFPWLKIPVCKFFLDRAI